MQSLRVLLLLFLLLPIRYGVIQAQEGSRGKPVSRLSSIQGNLSASNYSNTLHAAVTGNSIGANVLSIVAASGFRNERGVIEVELTNSESITAIQFDIRFPSVLTPVLDSIVLTPRKRDHVITSSQHSAGVFRMISFSPTLLSYSGNSGTVIRIPVVIGDAAGSYRIDFSNVVLGNPSGTNVMTGFSGGDFVVRSRIGGASHAIPLVQGWNMVSSYLVPDDTSMATVLSAVSQNLAIAKNGAGKVYWPALSINTIVRWNYRDAYQMYMLAADTLRIFGVTPSGDARCISLSKGWSLIAYLDSVSRSPGDVLGSCLNDLIIMKDNGGRVFWPALGINTLGLMKPGQGYRLFMSEACSFCFQ